jgi:hypothetical protein
MTKVGSTPNPDPTERTREDLLREIANSQALLRSELDGAANVTAEKFNSIETQFSLVERQRVEQKADTEKAVQAALSAAKEAVKEQTAASERAIAKSEAAITKQLEQLNATFTTANQGLSDLFGDLKERVGKIESIKVGAIEQREVALSSTNLVLGLMVLLVGVAAIVVGKV